MAGFLSSRNGLLVIGAGLVAAFALGSRGKGAAADDQAGPDSYEIDTTQTDLYNDLQPELENIADQLNELRPRPITPTPVPPTKPTRPLPAPRPAKKPEWGPGATGFTPHTVKAGESFGAIAKRYKTSKTALRYANLRGKKRADGTWGVITWEKDAKPGVVLIVPNSIKNTQR